MSMIYVTPGLGARVRMPERASAVMDSKGAWVPHDVHYERLLASGDLTLADPQPPKPGFDDPAPAPVTRATSASSKEK